MEWPIWYLVSAMVSFVCIIALLPVTIKRSQCWQELTTNIIGLILTLPIMTLMLAAVAYMASK